ncbi:MAG: hypothetical protein ABIW82_03880 [Dokdonella sp.]
MQGGRREGAGRKAGSFNKMTKRAREEAAKAGELPHEFLLRVARGEEIDGHTPEFGERVDAAKAAAPYYAPRLAATNVVASVRNEDLDVRDLSDAELMAIIARGN